MKANYIHVCFVIDKSGSMLSSIKDVEGGFKRIIEEQKQVKDGECSISLYTFNNEIEEVYLGKPIDEVKEIDYHPGGCTAMNDGIGTAIDNVGKWLNAMKEEDKPSKNLIVIMTDGLENASKEYTLQEVKDRIKHQEEKYNWSFMFLGADLTDTKDADELGLKYRSFTTKKNMFKNYDMINSATTLYRSAVASEAEVTMDSYLMAESAVLNNEFEEEMKKKDNNNTDITQRRLSGILDNRLHSK